MVTLAAKSTRNLEELTRVLERDISQRFEQIPGVGTIEIRGGVYREIHVNLKRDRLQASGLTPSHVRAALSRENATLPGGNVKEGLKDLYVRTVGEYNSIDQIANTVVTYGDEQPIRVRDVADVERGYEDTQRLAEYNGVPVVRMQIQKQSGANTVKVADAVRGEIERVNKERTDLELLVINDQSTFIRQSMSNVQQSAFWGGLLAIVVLYLFLRNGSSTGIVALAIHPLALGFGAGAEIQASLARVVIGGLTASTLITLVLIPVVYVSATAAVARARSWSWFSRGGEAPAISPAS